ncbi:MAG: DUF4350 domain-containing protein [Akkermansiaceae bacterium]
MGYKGQARANAFLAAQRYLAEQSYEVDTRSGIGSLDGVSTLFIPPSALNTEGRGKRLLTWVLNGGHLIVMFENGNKRGNDFHANDTLPYFVSDEELDMPDEAPGAEYILSQLGAEVIAWENEAIETITLDDWEELEEEERVLMNSQKLSYTPENEGESLTIHLWPSKALQYAEVYEEDEDPHYLLRQDYGEGSVTMLADANPLRNRYIGYADHARFLISMLQSPAEGIVVFSNGAGDSFFSLIWQYFKIAVLSFAAVIVFWLWKNLPRFGPSQDVPESEMRDFSLQVKGVGRFLWRHQRDDVMIDALRRRIVRHPMMSNSGIDDDMYQKLSLSSSLPFEVVVEAMTRRNIQDASVMVRVVKNLQLILKKSTK